MSEEVHFPGFAKEESVEKPHPGGRHWGGLPGIYEKVKPPLHEVPTDTASPLHSSGLATKNQARRALIVHPEFPLGVE